MIGFIKRKYSIIYLFLNYCFYQLSKRNIRSVKKLNIMTIEKTIDEIYNNGKSIARFGDGEFSIINGTNSPGFQKINIELQERLFSILNSSGTDCLIAIPEPMRSSQLLTFKAKLFWIPYLEKNRDNLDRILDPQIFFANSFITRPYLDFDNKDNANEIFNKLKSIWQDRDLIIVEGEKTMFGHNNNLLSGAKSIFRIETRSIDAFDIYDRILAATAKIAKDKNKVLVLVALGPTATVLAYDLSKMGIQAIDIGHLDIEYEWFLAGATKKQIIHGKHVNELNYLPELTAENNTNEKNILYVL